IVMFMRAVKSRVLYEQMKGRGSRVITKDDLLAVTPDAKAKTRFVLIDSVGVSESSLNDTRPLDQEPGISFDRLLTHVASGGVNPEMVSSLASRLSRLDKQLGPGERQKIKEAGGNLHDIAHAIVDALDADRQVEHARQKFDIPAHVQPEESQIEMAAAELIKAAVKPLATVPKLRQLLQDLKKQHEQIIDEVSQDFLLEAG